MTARGEWEGVAAVCSASSNNGTPQKQAIHLVHCKSLQSLTTGPHCSASYFFVSHHCDTDAFHIGGHGEPRHHHVILLQSILDARALDVYRACSSSALSSFKNLILVQLPNTKYQNHSRK